MSKPTSLWLLSVFLAGFICQCDNSFKEDLVDIPDNGFLDGLIAAGVDANNDGLISYQEAEETRSIVLPPSGVTDLAGLEAFVNLDSFSITLNPLSGIDLSLNSKLRYLEVTSCELSSLDLSENRALEVLICGRNLLEEIDVTHNLSLVTLVCNNNLFTGLDLAVNTTLTKMISCGNQLTSIDLSKNTALVKIGIDNMPMLINVCVWTLPFPPPGVEMLMDFSPNIVFTNQCAGF